MNDIGWPSHLLSGYEVFIPYICMNLNLNAIILGPGANISPCKINSYVFATEMQSHMVQLPFKGNPCRSYKSFVGTPLHPPQFKMPYQTPSARPEYMPHTVMWCLFSFPFSHAPSAVQLTLVVVGIHSTYTTPHHYS